MDIVSLIIMALGLIALVAIYVISRVSRQHLPKKQKRQMPIPVLRGDEGETMSSILEDRPARDGKRPIENAPDLSDVMKPAAKSKATGAEAEAAQDGSDPARQETAPSASQLPPQIILFIAADIDDGFSGDLVLEALDNGGLQYGEMDVFHRNVLTDSGEASLFTVANGVEPWTLKPVNLQGKSTPGLSLIMNLPAPIATDEAMHDFIRTAERLTSTLNGVLKNTQQEPLTTEQRQTLLDMAAS